MPTVATAGQAVLLEAEAASVLAEAEAEAALIVTQKDWEAQGATA